MDIKQQLKEAAAPHINDETCGFICHDGEFKYIPVKNRSPYPDQFFYISAIDFLRIKEENNLIAIFHNHCDGTESASRFDKTMSQNACYPMVIYSNLLDKFNIFVPDELDSDVKTIEDLKVKLND